MKVILAVDKNFAIGKDGDMLFSIPEDMQRFKELTTGNIESWAEKHWNLYLIQNLYQTEPTL